MEVHHHPHVHHEKKWVEYLFEFLMLFLAVTAGFFTENLREHYVEKQRARELVRTLAADLHKDVALLDWLDQFRLHKRKPELDSLYALLNTPAQQINRDKYYTLQKKISEWYPFHQSSGTMDQLENAGYLLYFSDTRILSLLSEYAFLLQDFKNDESLEFHQHYDRMMPMLRAAGDPDAMKKVYLDSVTLAGNGVTELTPARAAELKKQLVEEMWYNEKHMVEQNRRIRVKANEIITYLQQKTPLND